VPSGSFRFRGVADIGEDDHRYALLEKLAYGLRGRTALGEPHIGERTKRTREIVGGGKKRLRIVEGRASGDADAAPTPALVEQRDRTGERSLLISSRAISFLISTGSCQLGVGPRSS
jgi:hypothetical protein